MAADGKRLGTAAWRAGLDEALGARMTALYAGVPPLGADAVDPAELGLFYGRPGIALLHAELAAVRGSARDEERAWQLLDQAIEGMSTTPLPPALLTGYTGVAWASAHLCRLSGSDDDGAAAAVDAALLDHLRSTAASSLDLVGGLVGYGVYALDRLPDPTARACLEAIVARLEAARAASAPRHFWWTAADGLDPSKRARFPTGAYDTGVAHGVAGVISMLAEVWRAGVAQERVLPLLDEALTWLLAQAGAAGSREVFPSMVGDSGPLRARHGWCYGDTGIAIALLRAGRALSRPALESRAVELAVRAAADLDHPSVVDPSFCHGAAGLGHLFHRLYRATEEPRLAEAAVHWLSRAAAMGPRSTGDPWRDVSLFDGLAGVGLALLAAVDEAAPSWDRIALADVG